jgi:hypothetical protein
MSVSNLHSRKELLQLLEWYKIRDTLLGGNHAKIDVKKALELAAACEHPDAVWLTKLFGGRDVNTKEEAIQAFLCCENDLRALCFAAFLGGIAVEIRRSADLGDAVAQAWMACRTEGEEGFRWAEKSAAQGERNGFYALGCCWEFGDGCEEDKERAKENYSRAVELGYHSAMAGLGVLLDKMDPQKFLWLGKAATFSNAIQFMSEMEDRMRDFHSGTGGHPNVVFAIGRALKGQINGETRTIFGNARGFETYITSANQAVDFYEVQLESCRKAVDVWIVVAVRNNVVRDIRKMIAMMIWDEREEAKYNNL